MSVHIAKKLLLSFFTLSYRILCIAWSRQVGLPWPRRISDTQLRVPVAAERPVVLQAAVPVLVRRPAVRAAEAAVVEERAAERVFGQEPALAVGPARVPAVLAEPGPALLPVPEEVPDLVERAE